MLVKRIYLANPFLYLLFILSIFILYQGPVFYSDSGSYMNFASNRAPLYPIFLNLHHLLFGKYYLKFVIFSQLIIAIVAIHYFTQYFIKKIISQLIILNEQYRKIIYLITFLILFIPYISFGKFLLANSILSEGLCYPVFLFFLSFLIQGLSEFNFKKINTAILLSIVLVLIRQQFIFIAPTLVAWFLFSCFVYKNRIKFFFQLTLICLLSILASNLSERLYHQLAHQQFSALSDTAKLLSCGAFFIAKADNIKIFENDDIKKKLFQDIYTNLQENNLLMNYDHPNKIWYPDYVKYSHAYGQIRADILSPLSSYQLSAQQKSDLLINISLKLIWHNFPDFVKLVCKNIVSHMGGVFYVAFLLIFFTSTLLIAYHRKSTAIFLISLLGILHFANYGLISLVERAMKRYTMYTDTVTLAVVVTITLLSLYSTSCRKEY